MMAFLAGALQCGNRTHSCASVLPHTHTHTHTNTHTPAKTTCCARVTITGSLSSLGRPESSNGAPDSATGSADLDNRQGTVLSGRASACDVMVKLPAIPGAGSARQQSSVTWRHHTKPLTKQCTCMAALPCRVVRVLGDCACDCTDDALVCVWNAWHATRTRRPPIHLAERFPQPVRVQFACGRATSRRDLLGPCPRATVRTGQSCRRGPRPC